jgi:hypothetical protein
MSAGKIIPPRAATIGTIAERKSLRPCLISKPTKKKKIAINASMNMVIIYWNGTQQSPPFKGRALL